MRQRVREAEAALRPRSRGAEKTAACRGCEEDSRRFRLGWVLVGTGLEITRVEAGCYGEIGGSAADAHAVAVTALQGVLGRLVDETVNLVNASMVAESRGIELTEHRSDRARTFRNEVVVTVASSSRERTVAGALFEGRRARIVEIDGFDIDLRPAPWMLFMAYPDRPGMVGKFGTLLGEANVNIAGMSVGRKEKSGEAVVVLTVDDPVPEDVLAKIRAAIEAEEVRSVRL